MVEDLRAECVGALESDLSSSLSAASSSSSSSLGAGMCWLARFPDNMKFDLRAAGVAVAVTAMSLLDERGVTR